MTQAAGINDWLQQQHEMAHPGDLPIAATAVGSTTAIGHGEDNLDLSLSSDILKRPSSAEQNHQDIPEPTVPTAPQMEPNPEASTGGGSNGDSLPGSVEASSPTGGFKAGSPPRLPPLGANAVHPMPPENGVANGGSSNERGQSSTTIGWKSPIATTVGESNNVSVNEGDD